MSPVDYEALRGGVSTGVPDNGSHTARLERAALVETDKGSNLVTEWSEDGLWWTSWNRFNAQALPFTQALLDGLGVDRQKITNDDEFETALSDVQGILYLVHTDSKQGSQSDRWFINTYVDGRAVPAQIDMPVDTEGLPVLSEPVGSVDDEEDLPFHHLPFQSEVI
jgi:hypothetical protein